MLHERNVLNVVITLGLALIRFHGVLAPGNVVSVICTLAYKNILLALASVCENDYAENFWLPPTMARPKAFFAPIVLYRTMLAASTAIFICCAYIYTSNKPADILKEILIHVCASDLNSVLFAFVIFKICISFFIYFHQKKNTIGRGK